MKNNRKIILALLLALALALTGCSRQYYGGITERTDGVDSAYTQDILPESQNSAYGQQIGATLYFRYLSEDLLAGVEQQFTVTAENTLEQLVVQALIDGPQDTQYQYNALINPDTRLVSIKEQSGYLSITLSSEFPNAPADAPADWEGDAYWAQEVPRRRMLALQSIVCAITDLGKYDSVQLLIDFDGDGGRQGERVQRYYFYPGTAREAGVLLEAVRRDESAVLTARNTVGAALDCLQGKDWERLMQLIASGDSEGERPSPEEAQARLQGLGYTLTDFEVGDAMVAGDGGSATVCVDVQLAYGDGDARAVSAFPLLLRRDAGAWKVTWSSLMGLLEGY